MSSPQYYTVPEIVAALHNASACLKAREEDVNRLNVFPVPDGDTGTNMSKTFTSAVASLDAAGFSAEGNAMREAFVEGALMGSGGNSGVILSQFFRGFCEGCGHIDRLDTQTLVAGLIQAQDMVFHVVKKPIKGTILTVIKDMATVGKRCRKNKRSIDDTLCAVAAEAWDSVRRTPDLLPVLKKNNVVDAGGFGLAIIVEGFATALLNKEFTSQVEEFASAQPVGKVEIEQINDWEGSAYRYCTEFLVHSAGLDIPAAQAFVASMGDCNLLVGAHPNFKVHVHSNEPHKVIGYFIENDAQISEVHIHNMQLQSAERSKKISAEKDGEKGSGKNPVRKALGFVAVAAGAGMEKILRSLGVDQVVSGGQTMNPSTKDLLDAVERVNADSVIILPNNKNVIMAANNAAELASVECAVLPTRSVPEGFSAMFGMKAEESLARNLESMSMACDGVVTAEVTFAIKDSQDAHNNPIHEGDVIGITNDSIEAVGSSISEVVLDLLDTIDATHADTLTILAGEQVTDQDFDLLLREIEGKYSELEIDSHRGDQPLYPIVMSIE